jgi:hypothetical protein
MLLGNGKQISELLYENCITVLLSIWYEQKLSKNIRIKNLVQKLQISNIAYNDGLILRF